MGYTVFPLFPLASDGSCTCSDPKCERPGKHPAIMWGKLGPGEQVYGQAGHGIATGARSAVFVVDTDGPEADRVFLDTYFDGHAPNTYTVRTPSNGAHYYFAHPGFPVSNSQSQLLPHVDVRGDGGFVVMAGSPHKSGRPYVVLLNEPPMPAPAALLAWEGLRGHVRDASETSCPVFPCDMTTALGAKRRGQGEQDAAQWEPGVSGENGSGHLWSLALHLVRELELPVDVCADIIAEHYSPRCTPPWAPNLVLHKLEDARDKSDMVPGPVPVIDLDKLARTPTKAKPAARKQPQPGHRYTAAVGDRPNGEKRKITPAEVAATLATDEAWEGVLQYDESRQRIIAVDPPIKLEAERTSLTDADITSIRIWFELAHGYIVGKDAAQEAIATVALRNSFRPVQEYLEGLAPEPVETLDQAALLFFGSKDDLDRVLVRKFMIGAARRAIRPGAKFDTMLLLKGAQGVGKSRFVATLFGREHISEDLADLRTKDSMQGLSGKWAIEVAEIDKILRVDPETAKSFISRCVDSYRASYGRHTVDVPRACCFIGTSNRDDFLRDVTGERRYWMLETERIHLQNVKAWRDRMWSAAYALALRDEDEEPHWLTDGEAHMLKLRASNFEHLDPWESEILDVLAGRAHVVLTDVWTALDIEVAKRDHTATARITNLLKRLNCVRSIVGTDRRRAWLVPADIRELECSPKQKRIRATAVKS